MCQMRSRARNRIRPDGNRIPLIPLAAVLFHAATGCSMAYDTVSVPPDRTVSVRDSLLAALSGEPVNLVAFDGWELSGVGAFTPPDSFTVLTGRTKRERVRTDDITAVQFGGSPHAPAIGFLLAGAACAAIGAAVTAGSAGDAFMEQQGAAVSGGVVGLLVGGTLGAFVGRELGRGTEYRFAPHGPR